MPPTRSLPTTFPPQSEPWRAPVAAAEGRAGHQASSRSRPVEANRSRPLPRIWAQAPRPLPNAAGSLQDHAQRWVPGNLTNTTSQKAICVEQKNRSRRAGLKDRACRCACHNLEMARSRMSCGGGAARDPGSLRAPADPAHARSSTGRRPRAGAAAWSAVPRRDRRRRPAGRLPAPRATAPLTTLRSGRRWTWPAPLRERDEGPDREGAQVRHRAAGQRRSAHTGRRIKGVSSGRLSAAPAPPSGRWPGSPSRRPELRSRST